MIRNGAIEFYLNHKLFEWRPYDKCNAFSIVQWLQSPDKYIKVSGKRIMNLGQLNTYIVVNGLRDSWGLIT